MEHLQVQCPVCTLYLRNGMTLESHLDTHPKDQVIKALCSLTTKSSNYGSRTSTPLHSERSYRSRSRTPVTDERWNNSQQSVEHDRYWRRPPSRTPKSTPVASVSGNVTPESRVGEHYESASGPSGQHSLPPYTMKSDKTQQTYQNTPMSDFDSFYQDQQEDREIKFSRSAEYSAMNNSSVFTYNVPTVASGLRFQANTSLLPSISKKAPDFVKILPKPSNVLVKTNVGGVQYITSGVKPMHVMMPPAPAFVQKNTHNSMIMTSSNHSSLNVDKSITSQLSGNHFNHLASGNFTSGMSTVMTQNSQIVYREMVHNIDGKPFISSVPATITTGAGATLTQTNPLHQNVMVLDQFGACMYTTPQHLFPKSCTTSVCTENVSFVPTNHVVKSTVSNINDPKTLVIEVGPMLPSQFVSPVITAPSTTVTSSIPPTPCSTPETSVKTDRADDNVSVKSDTKSDMSGSSKGLKILSNIKVEVPVQHNKNMVNTIMDLTESNDQEYPEVEMESTRLPVLPHVNNKQVFEVPLLPAPLAGTSVNNSFSVLKHTNTALHKGSTSKSIESKLDTEYNDVCPVPELICNEKPSISPCSELSEHGENSTDRPALSPKLLQDKQKKNKVEIGEKKLQVAVKPYRLNTLRLNNLYVKKNKKILQIKNAKPFTKTTPSKVEMEPVPSSSRVPQDFSMKKHIEMSEGREPSTLQTVSVEEIKENEDNDDNNGFDADTEEHSLDMETLQPPSVITPTTEFSTTVDMVQVKEETNTSNESAFSNGAATPDRVLAPMESLRPINMMSYANLPADNFEEEANHRELMSIESASKNKQFVSMMNDNYFGDNMYPDYFTQERDQPPMPKETVYGVWGEPSQKDNEYVLPDFIHDKYKLPENRGLVYSELETREGTADVDPDGCERDSKADVLSEGRSEGEAPLNICADERMPPRGELSGQESNGDMESAWTGMYTDVPPSEPYDLMARESWISDGSDVDVGEKRENLEEDMQYPKNRTYTCALCSLKFSSPKELRAHRTKAHAAAAKTSYSRMITARAIKKEEKTEDTIMGCTMVDTKESITSTILEVYDMEETKLSTNIAGIIKQETKRRRRDFVCPTCKVDQLTDAAFHAHLKIHPLECLTCGKCFYRRANLALHIKMHLGIKNYKCDVCEKRFVTRQKLSEHENVHTGRAPVKCTVCDDTFRRYSNMVQHRDRHHFGKRARVRDFVCQCGAVFHSRAKLVWHQETHDERPKACLYCSDKFVHAASLTRHVRRMHNEYYLAPRARSVADNVPCPVCKQIYLRANLRTHLLTHSGKRPFVCIVCNKGFTSKWNLKLHRWTHMSRSAKPFKCNLCKGAFIRQTEYISHMNSHKSVRPYTCNYCGCQFIRKYNCQRHVREHEMAKKYVCKVPECGKSFHRSYYLSEHMKVHSGARPFVCNICGKTSSNKSNHNKHVKIHHAREPVATEA